MENDAEVRDIDSTGLGGKRKRDDESMETLGEGLQLHAKKGMAVVGAPADIHEGGSRSQGTPSSTQGEAPSALIKTDDGTSPAMGSHCGEKRKRVDSSSDLSQGVMKTKSATFLNRALQNDE